MRRRRLPDYSVIVADSAAREIRSLPTDVKARAMGIIDGLAANPRPRGTIKLKGHVRLYRHRVGVYRMVYEIDDVAKRVRVLRVRHRREVYD